MPPTIRRLLHHASQDGEVLGVALVLVGVGLALLRISLAPVQLSYDEAVYASEARFFVTGIPTGWGIWRPPLLPIAGLAALPFGLTDTSVRLIAGAGGLLAIGLAWGLTRLMWGRLAAAIALVVIIASPVVQHEVVLFHNDLPSSAPVLALMALLWWQLEVRPRPSALLVAAGPLAAAAFYMRYGALALLAGIALTTALLWGRRLLREPKLAGVTLLVTAALFLPHVVEAIITTGSPLGIVQAAVTQVDTTTPLQSAVQYVRWLPSGLAGPAGIVLVIAAVLGAARAVAQSISDRRVEVPARRLLWTLVPASLAAVATVTISHPEARYLLTPLILVMIAGAGSTAAAVSWATTRLNRTQPRVASLVVPTILVGLLLFLAVDCRAWIRAETRPKDEHWLLDAGRAIAADAQGACTVMSSYGPIVGWYSGCAPVGFSNEADVRTALDSLGPAYVVLTPADEGDGRRPEVLARSSSQVNLEMIGTFGQGTHAATVYRVGRDG